jgi:hypothetical protein
VSINQAKLYHCNRWVISLEIPAESVDFDKLFINAVLYHLILSVFVLADK